MDALDDGELFDRWLDGRDGDAFAALARRHSSVVFDIACRVLGDRGRAEDVLQEALLDLALEPTRKPIDVGVPAWLVRFTICRARNVRSSERSRNRRQIVVGRERPEVAMPDDALAHSDELETALAGCDPEDRALLAMRYLHGWDYDRISAALRIHPGAARVRVHRALQAVRAHAGAADDTAVRAKLAVLPVAALPALDLNASIRSVVELAKVRLGAPANGVEHATAASRSFRIAVTLAGTTLLFVGATAATVVTEVGTEREGTTVAALPDDAFAASADTARTASLRGASVPAAVAAGFRGVPRPPLWHHGALGGGTQDVTVDPPYLPRPATASPAPVADPASATVAVPAERPRAASADARSDAASCPTPPASAGADDSPSALRPMVRGACAAKGEPVSSDGERAGALGESSTAGGASSPAADTPADAPSAPPVKPSRSRAAWTRVAVDDLPGETRELLDRAQVLVRDLLVAEAADSFSDDVAAYVAAAGADGKRLRTVRKAYGRLAKSAAPVAAKSSPAAKRARAQAVRQVLTLLTEVVLADGRTAGELRWPADADVNFALQEVIRVLGMRPAGQESPDGAAPVPADAKLPSGAAEAP